MVIVMNCKSLSEKDCVEYVLGFLDSLGIVLAYVLGTGLIFNVMGSPAKQPVFPGRNDPQGVLENPHFGSQKAMLQ